MTYHRHPISALLLAAAAGTAFAADYPPQLVGTYVYGKAATAEACKNPGIVIEKQARYNEVDASCKATAVTEAGGKFTLSESCNREDSKWQMRTVMELKGGTLSVAESSKYQGNNAFTVQRCDAVAAVAPATPAAPPAPAAAAAGKVMNCTVNPGQAGVTTYLDDKLKKSGNAVRDFDGYTFKAEKTIKVNKMDILVGKLVRANGSVSEPQSYAMADEWTCK